MLTQADLQSLFNYDKDTGIFTRKIISKNYKQKVNSIAGTTNSEGYIVIGIDKKYYKAHRLAWLYVYGKFPKEQIDHINGIKNDNRICNLREVTNAENQQNRTKLNLNNKTGINGIDFRKNKYRVRICVNYDSIYIGEYKTLDEAKIELENARIKYQPFHTIKEK